MPALSAPDLRLALLIRVSAAGASFRDAKMDGVNLERGDLTNADLSGARLPYADFDRVKAVGAIFREADLSGAHFSSADLTGADLSGANLEGSLMRRTRLVGADLSGAKGLDAARMVGACGDATTKLPKGVYLKTCSDMDDAER